MFAFAAKHRGIWPPTTLCEALGVSRSGFYGWLSQPLSDRARRQEVMLAAIRNSFVESDRTYGARRVWRKSKRPSTWVHGFQLRRIAVVRRSVTH